MLLTCCVCVAHPFAGEARPGYVSESGMVSRDVNNATCVIPASSNVTNVDPASNEAQRQGDPSAAPVEQPQQLQQHKHRPQHHQEQLQALQHEQQDCTQQQQQQQHGQQTNSTPASPRTPRAQQQADAADAGAAATHQASDPPAAAGATGNAGTSGSDKQQRPSGRTGRHSEARAAAAAEAVARAETAANSKYPEPSRTPRDEDLGSCPPYATKAVWGLRYTMEDKWAAVPNLIQVGCKCLHHAWDVRVRVRVHACARVDVCACDSALWLCAVASSSMICSIINGRWCGQLHQLAGCMFSVSCVCAHACHALKLSACWLLWLPDCLLTCPLGASDGRRTGC